MKDRELQAVLDAHESELRAAVEHIGAPIKSFGGTGALNTVQRRQGCVGRVHVLLGDASPGWRAKDANNRRHELKTALRDALRRITGLELAVLLQASYSELVQTEHGVERRDERGRTTGVYRETVD